MKGPRVRKFYYFLIWKKRTLYSEIWETCTFENPLNPPNWIGDIKKVHIRSYYSQKLTFICLTKKSAWSLSQFIFWMHSLRNISVWKIHMHCPQTRVRPMSFELGKSSVESREPIQLKYSRCIVKYNSPMHCKIQFTPKQEIYLKVKLDVWNQIGAYSIRLYLIKLQTVWTESKL